VTGDWIIERKKLGLYSAALTILNIDSQRHICLWPTKALLDCYLITSTYT